MRVLVAEDDPALRSVIARGLEEAGYVVDAVGDGEEALAYIDSYEYGLAVVDWRMPVLSGLELVETLRRRGSPLPVLMLTARDLPADRVTGLDAGADDYLVKPFDFEELLARLRALRRRPAAAGAPAASLGDVTFDPARHEVTVRGRPVRLTLTELRILELLLSRAPAVVSRTAIARQAWHDDAAAVGSNTIDVHVAHLRAKLAGSEVRIETVRGAGYRMVASSAG